MYRNQQGYQVSVSRSLLLSLQMGLKFAWRWMDEERIKLKDEAGAHRVYMRRCVCKLSRGFAWEQKMIVSVMMRCSSPPPCLGCTCLGCNTCLGCACVGCTCLGSTCLGCTCLGCTCLSCTCRAARDLGPLFSRSTPQAPHISTSAPMPFSFS